MFWLVIAQGIAWGSFSWNLAGFIASTKHHPKKEPRLWYALRWVLHLLLSAVIYFVFAKPFILNI